MKNIKVMVGNRCMALARYSRMEIGDSSLGDDIKLISLYDKQDILTLVVHGKVIDNPEQVHYGESEYIIIAE